MRKLPGTESASYHVSTFLWPSLSMFVVFCTNVAVLYHNFAYFFCIFVLDASNLGEDVDATWRHADLNDVTARDEILLTYIAKGRAKFRESRPNAFRIRLGAFDPKIDIACGAR